MSANGPRKVEVTAHMWGVQDVFLGGSICLIVEATGVDVIPCEERASPRSQRLTFQGFRQGGQWGCPCVENLAGNRFGTWRGKKGLREMCRGQLGTDVMWSTRMVQPGGRQLVVCCRTLDYPD